MVDLNRPMHAYDLENVDKEISSDNKQPQISKQEVIPSQQGLLPHQQH